MQMQRSKADFLFMNAHGTVLVNSHIHPTSSFATGNMKSKLNSGDRREKISGVSFPPIPAQSATSCGISNNLYTMKFQRTTVN